MGAAAEGHSTHIWVEVLPSPKYHAILPLLRCAELTGRNVVAVMHGSG